MPSLSPTSYSSKLYHWPGQKSHHPVFFIFPVSCSNIRDHSCSPPLPSLLGSQSFLSKMRASAWGSPRSVLWEEPSRQPLPFSKIWPRLIDSPSLSSYPGPGLPCLGQIRGLSAAGSRGGMVFGDTGPLPCVPQGHLGYTPLHTTRGLFSPEVI